MKRAFIALFTIICIVVFSACVQDKKEMDFLYEYKYEYKNVRLLVTDRPDGIFVLEKPIKAEFEDGFIEFYAGYFNHQGRVINLLAYVDTKNAAKFEEKANDESHSLYCVVKVNKWKAKLTSYGYEERETSPVDGMTRYVLKMGYYHYFGSINEPLKVTFEDITVELPFVQKTAYSIQSEEGAALWQKYQQEAN